MDSGIEAYINNNLDIHSKAVYLEPLWISSVVNGANSDIVIPLDVNENVKFILVHNIIVCALSGSTYTVVNLTDLRFPLKTLVQFPQFVNCNFSSAFNYLVKGNSLTLRINSIEAVFSVMYQTITQKIIK